MPHSRVACTFAECAPLRRGEPSNPGANRNLVPGGHTGRPYERAASGPVGADYISARVGCTTAERTHRRGAHGASVTGYDFRRCTRSRAAKSRPCKGVRDGMSAGPLNLTHTLSVLFYILILYILFADDFHPLDFLNITHSSFTNSAIAGDENQPFSRADLNHFLDAGTRKNALPLEAVEGAAGASGKGQPSIWRPRKAATVWASFCSASVATVSFSSARRTTQPIRSPSERMGAATAKV